MVENGHQHTKTTEDVEVYILNKCSSFEKHSNKDWNTHIHLENNGPSIKIPLIFYLSMTFSLCFYHKLWVKCVCIHTGNSSGHTG